MSEKARIKSNPTTARAAFGVALLGVAWVVAMPFEAAALAGMSASHHVGQAARPATRAAVIDGLRAELGRLLKRAPDQVPIDKPVSSLGATELDVVEWQMAAERKFRVDIDDEKLFDPKTRGTRKDLTVTSMAAAVESSRPWPAGRAK